MRRCLALAAALLVAQSAAAATLFGIVSDRAAPVVAEAARRHLAAHPRDRLVLRTPSQFLAAPDREAKRWLAEADAVLAVAVFGDPARRLKALLQAHDQRALRVLAFLQDRCAEPLPAPVISGLQRWQNQSTSV